LDTEIEFRTELWEQIKARFRRFNREPTDNNKRQAYIPKGALAIENPVGTAPSFIVEGENYAIICLPGVPREMEYLLEHKVIPYLRQQYNLTGIIKARILHTAGIGESQIDDLIADLETLSNPTIGLSAHSGQVDIRITAKGDTETRADELITEIETEVRSRLGKWVYGADQDTLEGAALRAIADRGWSLAVIEAGLDGDLIRRLSGMLQKTDGLSDDIFCGGEVLTESPETRDLSRLTAAYMKAREADVCLGVAIYPGAERQEVSIVVITPDGTQEVTRPYGGPPEYAPRWALHHSLNLLRSL
jgi:hypothetical protein